MLNIPNTPFFLSRTLLLRLFSFLKGSKFLVSKNLKIIGLEVLSARKSMENILHFSMCPIILLMVLTLNACSSGKNLNWVKVNYPREYSNNYYGLKQIGPKTDKNNEPWVVYSANLSNSTIASPNKLEKAKDIFFLEPFYVVGQRGSYLKLMNHEADVLKGIRPDRTGTQDMGWIHQSKMLISSSAFTNPLSGFKNKYITAITDTFSLNNASVFLKNDSVLLFANQNLKEPIGKIGFHEVVYVMNKSIDNKKVFISNKPEISPKDVDNIIAGWISVSLIQDIGERLFYNSNSLDNNISSFHDFTKSLKCHPVFSLSGQNDSVTIKTADFRPVIDRSDNFIFNGNGNPIDYAKSLDLEDNLSNINVIFVIEAAQYTMNHFPSLVNTIQNFQMYFTNDKSGFNYRFGAVLSMKKRNSLEVDGYGLVEDYSEIFNFVSDRIMHLGDYTPITSSEAWRGLEKAVEIAGQDPDATNIIVLIGENGLNHSKSHYSLINQLVANNCRLFCSQVYSGRTNSFNNFSLQLIEFIEGYSKMVSKNKRELIVDVSQICSENVFTESQKNYYRLDYPKRSMTHGAIVFPEKGKLFSLEMFTSTLDSFITEVKLDNQLLIDSYQKAFRNMGNSKNKCDSVFLEKYNLSSPGGFKKELTENFRSVNPMWLESKEKTLAWKDLDFFLLLNQQEFEDLQGLFDDLTRFEVFDEFHQTSGSDMLSNQQAISTGKSSSAAVRMHLKNLLISRLERGKIKEALPQNIQSQSIGYILERITAMPVQWKYLNQINIWGLLDNTFLSDKKLDELIKYFEKQKQRFEEAEFDSFSSLEQKYYWVNKDCLF